MPDATGTYTCAKSPFKITDRFPMFTKKLNGWLCNTKLEMLEIRLEDASSVKKMKLQPAVSVTAWSRQTRFCFFFVSEHILFRTSLSKCICEIDRPYLSSAIHFAVSIVPNVSVMSFSHLCLDFPRLLFPATIPCINVFSKPLCRVAWPEHLNC